MQRQRSPCHERKGAHDTTGYLNDLLETVSRQWKWEGMGRKVGTVGRPRCCRGVASAAAGVVERGTRCYTGMGAQGKDSREGGGDKMRYGGRVVGGRTRQEGKKRRGRVAVGWATSGEGTEMSGGRGICAEKRVDSKQIDDKHHATCSGGGTSTQRGGTTKQVCRSGSSRGLRSGG